MSFDCLVHESFQVKGRDITEEERKMLEEEGVNIPYNVILTKVCCPNFYFILLFWISILDCKLFLSGGRSSDFCKILSYEKKFLQLVNDQTRVTMECIIKSILRHLTVAKIVLLVVSVVCTKLYCTGVTWRPVNCSNLAAKKEF